VDNELEVIRDEMEQTRANLAEKLGALETQVRETVSGATEAVSSTVEGVKDVVSSVTETVESVTETFNVSKQVEQHPWMALGAAVATGFVVAQVLGRSGNGHVAAGAPPGPPAPPAPSHHVTAQAGAPTPAQPAHPAPQQHEEHGIMHSLESMLPDMKGVMGTLATSLGGMAVGGLMGLIREMASRELPAAWKGDVTRLIDQVTTQLGGKPLDSAHSSSLLVALGLDGHHDQPSQAPRQEGTPAPPPSAYGTRAVPGRQPI